METPIKGAYYTTVSVVPASILKKLGIKPATDQEFRLADGSRIVRKKGVALFIYGDKKGGADVIFGEKGDSILLGALYSGGSGIDP